MTILSAYLKIFKDLLKRGQFLTLTFFLPALLSFTIAAVVSSTHFSLNNLSLPHPISKLSIDNSLVDISNPSSYQGLPVGEVKAYTVPHAEGTVIYLPQFHKSPVNAATDKVNDFSVEAQKESYQILDFLSQRGGVNLVMVEGNLYGEVPAEKIAPLASKITKKDELVSLNNDLMAAFKKKSINQPLENNLLGQLNTETNKLDREIILEGAPRVMKAEGKNITLFGAEDETTYKKAVKIYEDYRNLSDRINQLDNPTVGQSLKLNNQAFSLGNNSSLSNVLQLLLNKRSAPPFKPLAAAADAAGQNELASLIRRAEGVYNDLENNLPRGVMVNNSKETLLGNSNPYAKETSKNQLQNKLSTRKDDIEEVIIKERNQKAAENAIKALKEKKTNVAVLQFGAGHEEGLVKDLNDKGLNVVVVKPKEIVAKISQLDGV